MDGGTGDASALPLLLLLSAEMGISTCDLGRDSISAEMGMAASPSSSRPNPRLHLAPSWCTTLPVVATMVPAAVAAGCGATAPKLPMAAALTASLTAPQPSALQSAPKMHLRPALAGAAQLSSRTLAAFGAVRRAL